MISTVTRFSKGDTISSIFSKKSSLVATGLACPFVTVFWNRWPLNRCQWEGNTRAHSTLGLAISLKTGPHGIYHLQCFLETTQQTTVPPRYVSSLLLNPRQKQHKYSCGDFLGENHKSVAWWLRFGLSTGKMINSSGLSDKHGYQTEI